MRKMTHWYPPRHEAPSLRVDDRRRRAARLPLYSHAFGLSRLEPISKLLARVDPL
jgi:hypothetical protein